MLKMLLKCHKLRHITDSSISQNCSFSKNIEETGLHFLLFCPQYTGLREKFWRYLSLSHFSIFMSDNQHSIPSCLSSYILKYTAQWSWETTSASCKIEFYSNISISLTSHNSLSDARHVVKILSFMDEMSLKSEI